MHNIQYSTYNKGSSQVTDSGCKLHEDRDFHWYAPSTQSTTAETQQHIILLVSLWKEKETAWLQQEAQHGSLAALKRQRDLRTLFPLKCTSLPRSPKKTKPRHVLKAHDILLRPRAHTLTSQQLEKVLVNDYWPRSNISQRLAACGGGVPAKHYSEVL